MTDRIAELEMRIADHEKTIGDLSDVIAAQWKEIDALTGKLEQLSKRFAALEDLSAPDVPVTRPPHW